MAKIYKIEIEEILQKVVEVKANSLDEAFDIVQNKYANQEYILDYEDYKGVEFREYKDEILKSKKFKNRVDLIRVILQDNKSYTLEEVQKEIDKFMKRRVN